MVANPFKLHPLPEDADASGADELTLDLEDFYEPGQSSDDLTQETEIALAHELVLLHLARVHLDKLFGHIPTIDLSHADDILVRQCARATRKLRAHRDEVSIALEVWDGGGSVDPEGGGPRRVELTGLPVLVGRLSELNQLVFEDPEVAPLEGFFYQLGQCVIYHDVEGKRGTMLERVVRSKRQFIALKGEPCPLVVGDELSFGSSGTCIVVREIGPLRKGTDPLPVIKGVAAATERGPDTEMGETPRADSASGVLMQGGAPRPSRSSGRRRFALVLVFLLAVVVAGLFGRYGIPSRPPRTPLEGGVSTPHSASTKGASVHLVGGAESGWSLSSPVWQPGDRLFLYDSIDSFPIALAEVSDMRGAVTMIHRFQGVSDDRLSRAELRPAPAEDPRVALFLALAALDDGRAEEADKVFSLVTSADPWAAKVAWKGLALLAWRRHAIDDAAHHLEQARKLAPKDPEIALLDARVARARAAAGGTRGIDRDAVAASYRKALEAWLVPGASPVVGHELGLSGEALLAEYLDVAAPGPRSREVPETVASRPGAGAKGTGAPGGTSSVAVATRDRPRGAVGAGGARSLPSPVPDGAPGQTPKGRKTAEETPAKQGVTHTMVRVPAGPFLMGATDADPKAEPDERGHKGPVVLRGFQIDRTEVSNAMFEQVFPEHRKDRPAGADDNDPVVQVTWYEADSYCRAVGLRLPTEAEWEKAARGTDGRIYPWGDAPPSPERLNYRGSHLKRLAPVDDYPKGRSPYGARNMAGNAWEWTADWYDPRYYGKSPSHNPQGPARGRWKVIRGGSYADGPTEARTSNRAVAGPATASPKIGFRCAR